MFGLRGVGRSPVDIHLYNTFGDHTGLLPSSSTSSPRLYEKQIPNSYYREFGEAKYAGVRSGTTTTLILDGLALGSFTLNVDEISGDDHIVASTTFVDIPTTASTTGVLMVSEEGLASSSPVLSLDIDGDSVTDITLLGNSEGVSQEELVAILKGVVKTLGLTEIKEKRLLKKIDKLAKELAKEHKNQKVEKRKTKQVFAELLKTVDRYEKKKILSSDEANELREVVGQIKGSVIR